MKFILRVIFSCVVLTAVSCTDNGNKKNSPEVDTANNTLAEPKSVIQEKQVEEFSFDLVPMILADSNQKDPYKKYGFDLEGICYACDVANLSVSKHRLILTNACDSNKKKIIVLSSFENTPDRVLAGNADFNLKLQKIKGAQLYQLTIEGKSPESKDLKIRSFYCTKQELEKFQDHDCGDFEG